MVSMSFSEDATKSLVKTGFIAFILTGIYYYYYLRTSIQNLLPSSGGFADCSQLNTPVLGIALVAIYK